MKKAKWLVVLVACVMVFTCLFTACQPTEDTSLAELKTASKTEIEEYRNAKTAGDYDETGKTALDKAVADGKTAIDAAANVSGVLTAVKTAKTAIDKVAKKVVNNVAVSYAPVHGGDYLGMVKLTVNPAGDIIEAEMDEACYPSYVGISEAEQAKLDASDYATYHGHSDSKVYKNVKYADITLQFVEGEKGGSDNQYYVSNIAGGKLMSLTNWLADDANARIYFEAVASDNVTVILKNGTGTKEDKTLLTAANLLKSENGYWTKQDQEETQWKVNADATLNYVKENGIAPTFCLHVDSTTKQWVDGNNVSTGATWTDLASGKSITNGDAYTDYITLIRQAYSAATGWYYGAYSYANPYTPGKYYGAVVRLKQANGIITDFELLSEEETGMTQVTSSWDEKKLWEDEADAIVESIIGKTIALLAAGVDVTTDANGVPTKVQAALGVYVISGATQSTGRMYLAISDAILSAAHLRYGSYSYPNPYAPQGAPYGCMVKVSYTCDTIMDVSILKDEATGMVQLSNGWDDKSIWENGVDAYLGSFGGGTTVNDILALVIKTEENGTPSQLVANTGIDSGNVVTGATQSSGRLLLAMQNALSK